MKSRIEYDLATAGVTTKPIPFVAGSYWDGSMDPEILALQRAWRRSAEAHARNPVIFD